MNAATQLMSYLCLLFAGMAVLSYTPLAPAQERSHIAVVYDGGESTGPVEVVRALGELDSSVALSVYAPGRSGIEPDPAASLERYAVVFVDGASDAAETMARAIRTARGQTQVVVVGATPGLSGNVDPDDHPALAKYWAYPSQHNFRGLIAYLATEFAGVTGVNVAPPRSFAGQIFHHPDASSHFESLAGYLKWYADRESGHRYDTDVPSIGLAFHRNAVLTEDLAHIDATIRAIEARGYNAFPLGGDGAVRFAPHFLDEQGSSIVDVVLTFGQRLDFHDHAAGLEQARRLGVTLLGAFSHRTRSAEDYAASRTGLAPGMTGSVIGSERDGVIEPMAIGARGTRRDDRHFVEAMAQQVEWRVARAVSWARLHRLDNADKRVAITYWSEGGGRADLGGDPDDFLDVPETLLHLLEQMGQRGYDTGDEPLPDRDTLTRQMVEEGANVGSWAPAALEALVERGSAVTLPASEYLQWYEALPERRREEIEALWGPPPGESMVYRPEQGEAKLVIPVLRFGNVIAAPHPYWGYLDNEEAMMSRDATPPHHQYLAFFLWLQRGWQADAWVSMFSNIVLQPGVAEGPLADDHIGILLGGLPHIHPERLGSNGGIKNKRKGLAMTPGWYNFVVPGGELEALQPLQTQLMRHDAIAEDEAHAASEALIRRETVEHGLDRALGLEADSADFEDLRVALSAYLVELSQTWMPHGTKVLGEAPAGRVLADMVAGMLGPAYREAVGAHEDAPEAAMGEIVDRVLGNGELPADAVTEVLGEADADVVASMEGLHEHARNLQAAPRELAAVLETLEGLRLEPGPIDDPLRRPDAVPPGRVLYHFDPAAMPTPEAEAVGIAQAERLIEAHRDEHDGEYPEQLAFVLWSSDTTRNNGITEAQILALLGTRVVRDSRGIVTGVELVPRETLGRPRVDVLVTASGTYRDHFPGHIERITEAVALAADSPEADNPVARAVAAGEALLIDYGIPAEEARELARVRVYSEAPGAYSPNIQFLARSGDRRGDESRMAELYLERLSHAYGGGFEGEYKRPAFEHNLRYTRGAILPRSGHVNSLLDDPMPAGYLGGLNLAVRTVTGQDTTLYISDLRDTTRAGVTSAARWLQNELRTRYFNPSWLRTMMEHGYDGARNFMFLTEHMDLWNSTTGDMITSADWDEVKSVLVDDRYGLGLEAFFADYNPWAEQMMLVNMLGAARRGHWEATAEDLAEIARRLVDSALAHGPACEAAQCRDEALTEQVGEVLDGQPDAAPLIDAYRAAIASARAGGGAPGAGAAPPQVTGRAMQELTAPAPQPPASGLPLWLVLAALALVCVGWGWLRPGITTGGGTARA